MANPIIKIKRGATAPVATLNAGEFAIDQVAKNLYLGVEVGGVVTNEIVGGNGTFATHTDVATAVSNATGSLGTMSTQDANSVAITGGSLNNSVNALGIIGAAINGGSIDNTPIGATTPSTGQFTTIQDDGTASGVNTFMNQTKFGWGLSGVGSNPLYVSSTLDLSIGTGVIELGGHIGTRVSGLDAPVNNNDAARKKYVDDAISALGSVFHYVGDVSAYTDASNPFELANIVDQSTGAYYRVDVAGTYTAGVGPSMEAKVGDAFVKTTTGWQKLDNVDAEVLPTANEIAVTGDENVGYTVSIDPVFSGRMTTAEGDIWTLKDKANSLETKTQNIDFAGTVAGTTQINGEIKLGTALTSYGSISGSSIGIDLKDGSGTYVLHAGVWYGDSAIVGATNKLVLQSGGTDVEIRGTAGGMPGSAALITLDSATVSGNAAGTTTLENFIIDGGSY